MQGIWDIWWFTSTVAQNAANQTRNTGAHPPIFLISDLGPKAQAGQLWLYGIMTILLNPSLYFFLTQVEFFFNLLLFAVATWLLGLLIVCNFI